MEVLRGGASCVYNLSEGRSYLETVEAAIKKKQKRTDDDETKKRIELISDFEFAASCSKVCVSQNGHFIGAIGMYPPMFKLYETSELSTKHTRHFDSEPLDFLFLSEDYRKLVFLHSRRFLEFHSQGGRHHIMRIPCEGRSMGYVPESAELFVVGSSSKIFRIDLEKGAFHEPLVSQCEAVNFCVPNPVIPFFVTGGDSGIVELWDSRVAKSLSSLNVILQRDKSFSLDYSTVSATCGAFSDDGMTFCVGTSHGICRVYDIRSNKPIIEKDHCNDMPIVSVDIISKSGESAKGFVNDKCVLSADSKSIKLWSSQLVENNGIGQSSQTPHILANIETQHHVNNVCQYPNSGIIFVPQDAKRIGIYFLPTLGVAPKWCSFLESLTEELDESSVQSNSQSNASSLIHDNCQFVTAQQLTAMGASHLIKTPLLKPHLHGYLMESRLFSKLKSASEPFAAELYRKEQIKKKLDAKRSMRIQKRTKAPNVNAALAEKLELAASTVTSKKSKDKSVKKLADAASLLTDERFKGLFKDPDFAIEDIKLTSRQK